MTHRKLSVILPAKNEAESLDGLLPNIKAVYPDAEIIVVDDGSQDETFEVALRHEVTCVAHPYSIGNGGAIKTGARAANGEIIVFMDADGQHHPEEIAKLIQQIDKGAAMAVGARNSDAQSTRTRSFGNRIYNRIASWIVGHEIPDLTSGFRAVIRKEFLRFLHLLPNGFSYPTTITMAFFREGLPIAYTPVTVTPNKGHSHVSILKDGLRFFLIILRVGTLYSPLKFFVPISSGFFMTGILYYVYTYFSSGQFTNMGALLLLTAVFIFLVGLVSEQITNLLYSVLSTRAETSSHPAAARKMQGSSAAGRILETDQD